MTKIIAPETFIADEIQDAQASRKVGTVEITLSGKTKRVRAVIWPRSGCVTAYGVALRYPTGTKIWRGTVTEYDDGQTVISGGLKSRSRRFGRPSIVGFYDDVVEQDRSKS